MFASRAGFRKLVTRKVTPKTQLPNNARGDVAAAGPILVFWKNGAASRRKDAATRDAPSGLLNLSSSTADYDRLPGSGTVPRKMLLIVSLISTRSSRAPSTVKQSQNLCSPVGTSKSCSSQIRVFSPMTRARIVKTMVVYHPYLHITPTLAKTESLELPRDSRHSPTLNLNTREERASGLLIKLRVVALVPGLSIVRLPVSDRRLLATRRHRRQSCS